MENNFDEQQIGGGDKAVLTYESVFNRHLDRLSAFIPQILANSQPTAMLVLAVYSEIKILHGFILAGHTNKQYKDSFEKFDAEWKAEYPITKLGEIGNFKKGISQFEGVQKLLDILTTQMEEVDRLGLTRPRETAVFNGSQDREEYVMTPEDEELLKNVE